MRWFDTEVQGPYIENPFVAHSFALRKRTRRANHQPWRTLACFPITSVSLAMTTNFKGGNFSVWIWLLFIAGTYINGAPLDIEVTQVENKIEVSIKNNTGHKISYQTGIFRGFHFWDGSSGLPKKRILDDGLHGGSQVLSVGEAQRCSFLIDKPFFLRKPNTSFEIDVGWGDVEFGAEGLLLSNLQIVTDAAGAMEIRSTDRTRIEYTLPSPDFKYPDDHFTNVIVPMITRGNYKDANVQASIKRILDRAHPEPTNIKQEAASTAEAAGQRTHLGVTIVIIALTLIGVILARRFIS